MGLAAAAGCRQIADTAEAKSLPLIADPEILDLETIGLETIGLESIDRLVTGRAESPAGRQFADRIDDRPAHATLEPTSVKKE